MVAKCGLARMSSRGNWTSRWRKTSLNHSTKQSCWRFWLCSIISLSSVYSVWLILPLHLQQFKFDMLGIIRQQDASRKVASPEKLHSNVTFCEIVTRITKLLDKGKLSLCVCLLFGCSLIGCHCDEWRELFKMWRFFGTPLWCGRVAHLQMTRAGAALAGGTFSGEGGRRTRG